MGSAKKKADKKKDFQKAKLKVGKTKQKPSNYTDTSFTAKTISLPNQSISSKSDLDIDTDLIKRLSLLKHSSHQTRKETVIYITNQLPNASLSTYKPIISSILPLILDQNSNVRTALLGLFQEISKNLPNLIELHTNSIILFIHTAMTHINQPIRTDSIKFLNFLIEFGSDLIIRTYWIKTLKNYFTLLNWNLIDSKQSISLAVSTSSVLNKQKYRKDALDSLQKYIKLGITNPNEINPASNVLTPHSMTMTYMTPNAAKPFQHLNLFTRTLKLNTNKNTVDTTLDLNSINCEDFKIRIKILKDFFNAQIIKNCDKLIKEGGDIGKNANSLMTFIEKINETKED